MLFLHNKDNQQEDAMRIEGDHVEINEIEASGGESPHIVRYVLLFSLLLAIAGLSTVWIFGALTFS